MKDFSMKKRPDYIKNCYREEDGSLTVVFADGTIYADYLDTEENIAKIDILWKNKLKKGILKLVNLEDF